MGCTPKIHSPIQREACVQTEESVSENKQHADVLIKLEENSQKIKKLEQDIISIKNPAAARKQNMKNAPKEIEQKLNKIIESDPVIFKTFNKVKAAFEKAKALKIKEVSDIDATTLH